MGDTPATRQTRQKEALERALSDAGRAKSMDDILREGRSHYPGLSERTVFRRLKELMAEGKLVRVYLPGHPARYEVPTHQHRPHLVCRKCEQVYVLPAETPSLLENYPVPEGFSLEGEEVVFYGTCPECQPG
ncbi:MAG: Fur family transcriptional regulator [Opitutales bacterium]